MYIGTSYLEPDHVVSLIPNIIEFSVIFFMDFGVFTDSLQVLKKYTSRYSYTLLE